MEYEPEGFRPTRDLEDKLCEVAEGYCPQGYENNDGGYGTLYSQPVVVNGTLYTTYFNGDVIAWKLPPLGL